MQTGTKKDVLGNVIINEFRGEYFFLSNFYLRPMTFRGFLFHSSEQAYMWCKTLIPEQKAAILALPTPGRVKRFADDPANVTLRPEWNTKWRLNEMREVVHCKYQQHLDLIAFLLKTASALLIEGNRHHDNFWGDCRCGERKECEASGENHLGRIHMAERELFEATK